MQLSRLTDKGIAALAAVLVQNDGDEAGARALMARALVADRECCVPVQGAGEVDPDARFATAMQFCQHVWPAMEPLGEQAVEDVGVNAFLCALYLDQLAPGPLGALEGYLLNTRTIAGVGRRTRNYRNRVFAFLWLYSRHSEDQSLCQFYLNRKLHLMSKNLERLMQVPEIASSRGSLQLVSAMLRKGGRPKPLPTEPAPLNGGKAMQAVASILYTQCSWNFDIENMSAVQLLDLVPRNHQGLVYWRRMAEEQLCPEGAAEKPRRRRAAS